MWRRFLQRRWPGYPSYRASVILFDELAAYERPRPLTPLLLLNIVGFYSGVVAAALTEQLYKVSGDGSVCSGRSLRSP